MKGEKDIEWNMRNIKKTLKLKTKAFVIYEILFSYMKKDILLVGYKLQVTCTWLQTTCISGFVTYFLVFLYRCSTEKC